MEHYLIIARSVTYAQRMQRALARSGIRSRIFRAPGPDGPGLRLRRADRGLRPDGCPDGPSQGIFGPCSDILDSAGDVPGGETVIYFDSAATTFQKPRTVADACGTPWPP